MSLKVILSKRRKGQSAIEYLTTYGWMLLVIAIVGGAIFTTVQNSAQIQSTSGMANADVQIAEFGVTDSGLKAELRAASTDQIENVNISLINSDTGEKVYASKEATIPIGDTETVEFVNISSSQNTNTYNVKIKYDSGSLTDLTVKGSLTGQLKMKGSVSNDGTGTATDSSEVKDIEIVETSMQGIPEDSDMKLAQNVWENSFDSANESIHIEAPYLKNDSEQEFRSIYSAINDSVRNEGVKLKIITKDFDSDLDYLIEPQNAELIETSALDTHAKYWVVDKDEVFFGSQNWASTALLTNHEQGLFTDNDKVAKTYSKLFSQGWADIGGEPVGGKISEFSNFNPIASGEQTENFDNHIDSIKSLIESSDNEVDIFVYEMDDQYWVNELENSAVNTANNGIDVDIMVEGRSFSHTGLDNLTRIAENNANIEAQGVENAPHFAHQKNVIVDKDKYYIGSANFRTTSMYENREAGAIVSDENTAEILDTSFEDYWTSDYAVNLTKDSFSNKLANPSFEIGNGYNATNWTQDTYYGTYEDAVERNSLISKNQSYSIRQVDITGSYGRFINSKSVPVDEGREYSFGAYYYLNQTTANPDDYTHYVQIKWLDGSKNELTSDPGSGSNFQKFESWEKVNYTREAPENSEYAKLSIRSRDDVGKTTDVYWDQAFIRGP